MNQAQNITLKKALYYIIAALVLSVLAILLNAPAQDDGDLKDRVAHFDEHYQALIEFNKQIALDQAAELQKDRSAADNIRRSGKVWKNHQTALFLYDNGKLIGWNTSDVPLPFQIDERKPKFQGTIRQANGIYLATTAPLDSVQELVCLTLVRAEYPISNKYLSNEWNPALEGTRGLEPFLFNQTGTMMVGSEENRTALYLATQDAPESSYISGILWIIVFVLLIMALYRLRDEWFASAGLGSVSFLTVSLVVLRALMILFEWPGAWYELPLFDPSHHATHVTIPSLADLFLNMLVILAILREIGRIDIEIKDTDRAGWVSTIIGASIMLVFIYPVGQIFKLLVFNSSFSLDLTNPFGLDVYSLIGLVITAVMLYGVHRLFTWVASLIAKLQPNVTGRAIAVIGFVAAAILISKLIFPVYFWMILAGAILITFLLISFEWQQRNEGFSQYTSNVLVYAILASILLMHYQNANELDERKTIAQKVFSDQDPVAEFLFDEFSETIQNDRKIKGLISILPAHKEDLLFELERKLQYDPWSKFNATIHIFDSKGEALIDNAGQDAIGFMDIMSRAYDAQPTASENLFYKGIVKGNGGYIARVEFKNPRTDQLLAAVFIEFESRTGDNRLGFPELLLDSRFSHYAELRPYSYARYRDGELLSHTGTFSYSLDAEAFGPLDQEFTVRRDNEHSHLIYRPVEGMRIVMTKSHLGLLSYFTVFSYMFLLYFIVSGIALFVRGRFGIPMLKQPTFRNRINVAMISILTFTIVLIGLGTVMYVVEEYRTKNHELISEKMRSVLIEMEHKLRNRETLEPSDHDELTMLLSKFSKVFFTDINLYDLNGNLLATSRPKVFEEGLVSSRMDPTAFLEMTVNKRSEFVHNERIGKLNFLAAYAPFRNVDREFMAYLSLPYFARQNGLEQEVVSLLAALTNIYVLLILVAVVLALVISNRITEPLRIIRENLKTLKLDKRNQRIEWESNDEIGELVEEYNRTLSELVKNAELLARSERESAWREMAKQVAHEIKNPLTPMKLNVQMLERSYRDGADDLGERIERTAKNLIEQIDTLSDIATEFSSFAKMPKAELENVELIELLTSSTELYGESDKVAIRFNTELTKPINVEADRKQMLRVLNNLIKNGIQAIPDDREGRIELSLKRENGALLIAVRDNGSGIPEDVQLSIFVPNFTTKTSGMGLGLAMVKNIIEGMGGKIWFETQQGTGTTFFIQISELA